MSGPGLAGVAQVDTAFMELADFLRALWPVGVFMAAGSGMVWITNHLLVGLL